MGGILGDRVRVAVTGGDHQSMVRRPHAREVAAAITCRLDEFDGAMDDGWPDVVPLNRVGGLHPAG